MHLVTISLLLLASSLATQQLSTFGATCGARGTLLAPYGVPAPGGTIELQLASGAPTKPHELVLGLSNTRWSGGSLPWFAPPGLGFATGCALRVSPDLFVAIAVDKVGIGRLVLPIVASYVGATVHAQALGTPGGEPFYLTNGVTMTIGAPANATFTSAITRRSDATPIANARVTIFAPGLSSFFETRADALGLVTLPVPRGLYRLGVAARGYEYVEQDVSLFADLRRDHALDPETHAGRWDVIGNTDPEQLDATDIAYLLPDGRCFYCHDSQDPIVFDPVTGAKAFPGASSSEQGCSNGTLLEDGRLILVGGQNGGNFQNATREVKSWSFTAGWQDLQQLLNPTGRWYPGLARLADGRLLVMGGGTRPSAARTPTCEIFDQATQQWTPTGSMGTANEFAPSALLYNGKVLRTWGGPELFDVGSGTWSATGAFQYPSRGFPGHSDHSIVHATDGRVLAIGINTSLAGANAAMVESYDPSTGQWTALSSPSLKRMQSEVVYLPDGNVLVAAGDKTNQVTAEPVKSGIVKRSDLYDPRTDRWRRVADMLGFREYHAVTLLLPDGRVSTTGGTVIKFQNPPVNGDIEGYSPPYVFRGVRPQIANPSTTTPQRGARLSFDVLPATKLTSVVLIGTGVHTHWVDGGIPRRLELPVTMNGARATVTLPTDPNVIPIGHYLCFAMVDDIPSVALIVRVRA